MAIQTDISLQSRMLAEWLTKEVTSDAPEKTCSPILGGLGDSDAFGQSDHVGGCV
jgi:hypothetical protein